MFDNDQPIAAAGKRRHWVYVIGDRELRESARQWRDRKTAQGKLYEVIEAGAEETPDRRLAGVTNDEVLYIYSSPFPGSPPGIGVTRKTPAQLAAYLAAEGLDAGHRDLKLFFSGSGEVLVDDTRSASYAERLYEYMRTDFPRIVVFGYFGEVSPDGYGLHKTAAMARGENPADLTEEVWNTRGLRASQNRVRFPPEDRHADPSE